MSNGLCRAKAMAEADCELRAGNRVSDFYLADLPPGSPERATGKSDRGARGGYGYPPAVTVG